MPAFNASSLSLAQIVPGAASGSTAVYEDDGSTTAYLTAGASAWTTATYSYAGSTQATVTVSTNGSYPELPASRAYQARGGGRRALRCCCHCCTPPFLPCPRPPAPLPQLGPHHGRDRQRAGDRVQPLRPHRLQPPPAARIAVLLGLLAAGVLAELGGSSSAPCYASFPALPPLPSSPPPISPTAWAALLTSSARAPLRR